MITRFLKNTQPTRDRKTERQKHPLSYETLLVNDNVGQIKQFSVGISASNTPSRVEMGIIGLSCRTKMLTEAAKVSANVSWRWTKQANEARLMSADKVIIQVPERFLLALLDQFAYRRETVRHTCLPRNRNPQTKRYPATAETRRRLLA